MTVTGMPALAAIGRRGRGNSGMMTALTCAARIRRAVFKP